METKECNKCDEVKPLSKFYKNKETKDGLYGACAECRKEWQRRYQKRNNEKIVETHRRYRKTKLSAGIYTITNRVNGKIYVGQSRELKRRLSDHRLRLKRNNHRCDDLQEDYNTQDPSTFKFEVAKKLPADTPLETLLLREAQVIHQYVEEEKALYNTMVMIIPKDKQ